MDQELRLFRDLILAIWDNYRKPWFYPRGQARDIYLDINTAFPSFTDRRELERALPSEGRVKTDFPASLFLYLEPVHRGQVMVPVLTIKSDFGRTIPELRLRLGLFLRYNRDIKAIGYRFEAPEGPGIHHYYHMQMIHGFSPSVIFPPNDCHIWIPDTTPTFPLDVDGSVSLMLSLLISLYGVRDTIALVRNASTGAQLAEYIERMNCYAVPTIEWFWEVTFAGPPVRRIFYKSPREPREFREHFASSYPGCQIRGITEGFYVSQSKSKRRVHR
jgi:hypothetical protein